MGIFDKSSLFGAVGRLESAVTSVFAKDAYDALMRGAGANLVDVRTNEEWRFVGVPFVQSAEAKIHFIEWRVLPDMQRNQGFLQAVTSKIPAQDAHIFLICRSGVRSMEAASYLMRNGYMNCYNVEYGFEGELDMKNQRGLINGWKASGLPWVQT